LILPRLAELGEMEYPESWFCGLDIGDEYSCDKGRETVADIFV
jgi:hypothetical protein